MSVRKRNEYLEGGDSDEELDIGYDSDAGEEGRGAIAGRTSKRRKTDVESDDESFYSFQADDDDARREINSAVEGTSKAPVASADRFVLGSDFEDDEHIALQPDDDGDALPSLAKSSTTKSKAPKSVAAAEKAARNSGVLYISRVPPFMKPQTLRHYLTPHAPRKGLGRIFLTPEDHTAHTQRVKRGGNKKKTFTDGWVEFGSKTEAKMAAEMLNGNIIGGKKGGFYYDDLWNMKYLRGFKWGHLTEQISNENASRAARLREEVRKTRKENKSFVEDIERGKMLEGMEGKNKGKRKKPVEEGASHLSEVKEGKAARPARAFKQRKVLGKEPSGEGGKPLANLQRMGMLF